MLYRTIIQATQLNTQNETMTNPICGQGVFVVTPFQIPFPLSGDIGDLLCMFIVYL